MGSVRFEQVTKRYGSVVALSDLDLEIQAGEFVSLLGPSGSGKTTSLNLLAGLLAPDAGEIFIADQNVTRVSPDRRNIAMVFQNYALYPHMTVAENLAFPLLARRPPPSAAVIQSKIDKVAETLGILELRDRYPKGLSGGQQQRVALGRALIRDPSVFLLDEPLSNLDARLRIRMRHDIKALHAKLQSTIVYVTHDQAEAMTLSTRIAVFNKGHLQQFAEPAEIYNNPANMFVANFVGEREMNFLEGVVRMSNGHAVLDVSGLDLALSDSSFYGRLKNGQRLIVGVRPEGLVPEKSPSPANIPAKVTLVELSGPDLIVYAQRISDGGPELCCRASPTSTFAVGETVHVRVEGKYLLGFDPATTNSIATH